MSSICTNCLKSSEEHFENKCQSPIEVIRKLQEEVKRLREALEYYANEKIYTNQISIGNGLFMTEIENDGGRIAEKALRGF